MGRSEDRHAGRGGRGRFNRNNQYSQQKSEKKKKTIEDYCFYVGSSKQASDFETTSEFILNYVKKTYHRGNDISESLRELKKTDTNLWKPKLQFSTETEDEAKKRENRQFELEHKAEFDEYMKRKRDYEENVFKAYAEIWDRCNKAMQGKLEARTDYESKIYNDPIELLRAVKEHALNYQESRYEMSIITDAFRAFLTVVKRTMRHYKNIPRGLKCQKKFCNHI